MAEPSRPHVVLVGLPGSGKSTVGAELARQLGRKFVDFDVELARREGMTITQIFGDRGESYFRRLEHGLTEEFRTTEGMVLAPGGGWVARPESVALLRPPALLVYLRLSAGAAIRHMGRRIAVRPLLQHPDPHAELERLLAERRVVYESSDVVVDAEHINPQGVTARIMAALKGMPRWEPDQLQTDG